MVTEPAPAVRPTRIEVDLAAIRHNVGVVAVAAGRAALLAVVKADGYGHGSLEVARTALAAGVTWLAVALVEEAEVLRAGGITAPILLLSEPLGQSGAAATTAAARRVVAADVTPSVCTIAFADLLRNVADRPVPCHLVVDTGMGRLGCRPDEVATLLDHPGVDVTGVWTHLARADEGVDTTDRQLARYDPVVEQVRHHRPDAVVHAANSAGILRHPAAHYDLVRMGIVVYGLSPAADLPATGFGLRQALSLRSGVSFAKRIEAGTPVAYGHTWSAPTGGWLATVPIGYADGVPRVASNRLDVLLDGRRFPQVGRVTMDQVLVFTGDHQPRIGDEVVLLGPQGDEFVSVDEWAAAAGTISYEITCQLTSRIPRHHVDDLG